MSHGRNEMMQSESDWAPSVEIPYAPRHGAKPPVSPPQGDQGQAHFTEMHSHFVYGLDDGAQTYPEMCGLIDQAWQMGVRTLYATPHCVPGIKFFDRDLLEKHLQEARLYCREKGYDMELLPGAEMLWTPQMSYALNQEHLPCLGNTRFALVEFSPSIEKKDLFMAIELMIEAGYRPVIAHFERYACLLKPGTAERLKRKYAVKLQMNAETLTLPSPLMMRLCIKGWLKKGLVDCISSDAHHVQDRPFAIGKAYEVLTQRCGQDYADFAAKGGIFQED